MLVFERLWEETGCRNVIADLAGARGHKFALERAVFLTVLHRLFVSGSTVRGSLAEDYMSPAWRGSVASPLSGDGVDDKRGTTLPRRATTRRSRYRAYVQ